MVSVYSLKPGFQRLLRPFVTGLYRAGITANQVTVVTCVASVVLGAVLCWHPHWMLALPIFLFFRMALNAADGMLAREFRQQSALGSYLNELGDVVSDSFLYLPFAFVPGFAPLWIGAVLVLSVISEMSGVLAVLTGAVRRYDGPMGKSDRAAVFGVLAVWIGLGLAIAPWVSFSIPVMLSSLLIFTIVNRVRSGLKQAARLKGS